MRDIKQQELAKMLGISRPGWQKQEATGRVNEKHWPAIEKTIGMNKEQLEDLDEGKLNSLLMAQPQIHNKNEGSNYVCVVNLNINGADVDSIEKLKGLFEQMLALQKKDDGLK